jgi:Sulfotransferase family
MGIPPELRFFFIHVMKTGGGTFSSHIMENFDGEEVYPSERLDPDIYVARAEIGYLTALPPERRARIRVYRGHFPFVAAELLGEELVTITILRDPVERTISYLKHCKRYKEEHRSLSLEQIYQDPFFFPTEILNHQAKLFAMTSEDEPESYLDVIEIDDRRLEIAKANLERVDVLGFQEHFQELVEEMGRRYGWRFGPVGDRHVGPETGVSGSFRRRIAEENAADLEFYEHARALWKRRRAGGRAPDRKAHL